MTESPVVNLGCGISRKRNIFHLRLKPRQGDLSLVSDNNENKVLVVGGEEVEENSYPWMAALGSSNPDTGRVTW